VRLVTAGDLDAYLPAAAAMFAEELGISPYRLSRPADYRRRVAGLVHSQRSFAVFDDDGGVLFKADIGALSRQTCQVQGVWVRPDRRGLGLGTAAMASVLRAAVRLAPTVSLYVNDFNEPARRMYARLGLRQAATLSTVLF
jgi:predicted GNAT family acetyltransferase